MPHYIGRFAPSPTGLLHIGSLLTAIASYADARAHGGQWLLRMEDLDPPREMAGAADNILFTLEQFGFEWDGAVAYQSQRHALYRAALGSLKTAGLAYPCYCSRKDWHAAAQMGVDGFVYNGACRPNNVFRLHQNTRKTPAWRCCVPMAIGRISWRWWWTMPRRASPILCAGRICWFPRRAKCICNAA